MGIRYLNAMGSLQYTRISLLTLHDVLVNFFLTSHCVIAVFCGLEIHSVSRNAQQIAMIRVPLDSGQFMGWGSYDPPSSPRVLHTPQALLSFGPHTFKFVNSYFQQMSIIYAAF